ncbi:secretion protein HlyD [Luteolibacter pohnpeiensis]|uniref:Secretion protein HlyD n=1 Tax=Luteolibacter pohnpeiensis TaxID=454153 RepID=A0A934S5B7_9BACT|nr:secretion protein HlyD [Luteolibacter pohnpeiensis]MBK1881444.1 secretion protein HlyD [Luteolibacter pohnpeiensis]
MKKIIIPLILLVAAGAVGWHFYSKYEAAHEPLKLYGNVDIRGVDLGFRVAGRVQEVIKDEGDPVKKGELLATLDAVPYQHELAQAKASLQSAEAELQLKQAGYRTEEIEQARATMAESEASLEGANRNLVRQKELVSGGGVSQQALDDAQTNFDVATEKLRVSKENLKQLESGYRVEEIEAAKAQVAQAKAALDIAQTRLDDVELHAPADGILLTRALEPGAIVQAGTTVLSISLEDPVWVRAYVTESELGQVSPGTAVLLKSDSQPDHVFHGRVGFVSPRAEFTPKSVETPDLRTSLVYRLRVVVSDSDGTLRQGMPVTVSLDPSHN